MGPTGCPETPIRKYHYWLHNNPEERKSRFVASRGVAVLLHLCGRNVLYSDGISVLQVQSWVEIFWNSYVAMNYVGMCTHEVQSRAVSAWVAVTVVLPLSMLIVRRRLLIATAHSRQAQCKQLPVTTTGFLHNSTLLQSAVQHISRGGASSLSVVFIVHFVIYLHLFVCSLQ